MKRLPNGPHTPWPNRAEMGARLFKKFLSVLVDTAWTRPPYLKLHLLSGSSIFQVNASKTRRPLDNVDLEELPDSREHTGAPVLWLSNGGQTDVWELFTDTSYLSAILDRQGFSMTAPIDLRIENTRKLLVTVMIRFLVKAQRKESQDRCDVANYHFQKLQPKGSHMATVPSVFGRCRISNPGGQKGTISSEKISLPMDFFCVENTQVGLP